MSFGIATIHSHSALEGKLKFPKRIVLVDSIYSELLDRLNIKYKNYRFCNKMYLKVATADFVRAGGVFHNAIE